MCKELRLQLVEEVVQIAKLTRCLGGPEPSCCAAQVDQMEKLSMNLMLLERLQQHTSTREGSYTNHSKSKDWKLNTEIAEFDRSTDTEVN